jgi:hypothetical protein
MAKKPELHPYSDRHSFERLMLLIATLIKYPGVGCITQEHKISREKGNHHDALVILQQKVRELGKSIGIEFKEKAPATATLNRDLQTLREYEILERRMYRWGYYLGTGVMDKYELKAAFEALESMAVYQGEPSIRQIYHKLKQRIKGFELGKKEDFFYPVRQNINQAINYTDPEEMILKGRNQHTLYHHMDKLEEAIIKGQAIDIARKKDLYEQKNVGLETVIPLQIIYYDISWYLIYQSCKNNQLIIGRINRFSDHYEVVSEAAANLETKRESLKKVYQLLETGWGLNLGSLEEQELELRGKLTFEEIKVRFYPPVSEFIREGELRHQKQKVKLGKKIINSNKYAYVDYLIALPPRSLNEFRFWLQRYGACAEVIYPSSLRQLHDEEAIALSARYSKAK